MMSPESMVRRLIPAAAVSLVTSIVLGGVAVATDDGSAGPVEGQLPDHFGVATPRLGDSWSYNVTLKGGWTFGLEDAIGKGESTRFGDFQWVETGRVRGGDGRMHDANRLVAAHLSYHPYVYDELPSTPNATASIRATNPFWYDIEAAGWYLAGGTTVVQEGFAYSDNYTDTEYGIAAGVGAAVRQHYWLYEDVLFPEARSHCLALNALQGANLSMPASLELVGSCELGRSFLSIPAGLQFAPRHVDHVNGVDTVLFEGRLNGTFRMWFNPDIPYPVRVAFDLPSQRGLDDAHGSLALPGARSAVLDLVGFAAGAAPLDASDDAGSSGQAPDLRFAQREAWGMDDSGVDHPFPLSVAYQAALDDNVFADLRTYTLAHPDAYVAAVEYHEHAGQMTLDRRWEVGLTDGGEETFGFTAIQRNYGPLFPVAMRELAPSVVEFDRSGGPWFDWYNAPDPDAVPDLMPTVASLADRWAAFDGSGLAMNAWGFTFGCLYGDDFCEPGRPIYLAGHSRDEWNSFSPQYSVPADPYGADNTARIERLVAFDSEGNALFMSNEDDRTTTTPVNSGPVPSSPPGSSSPGLGPVASSIEVVPVRAWLPAADKAAGIGLFAIAAGALYWVFPKLKALALLGLFSRVHGDQLLEHPARQNLLNLIEAQPGVHLNELGRKSGLPNGTLTHHLEKLRSAGIVIARPMGGYTCYFARGTRADPGAAALKSAGARQVLDALRKQPGLSNLELAQATGLQPSTVNYHVQKLAAAGLVGSLRTGRSVRLHALAA